MMKSRSPLTARMAIVVALVGLLALTGFSKGARRGHDFAEDDVLLDKDTQGDHPLGNDLYFWNSEAELRKFKQMEMLNAELNAGKTFGPTLNQDSNDVAVLVDDGTGLIDPNPFDLGGKVISFIPAGGAAYNVTSSTFALDANFGTKLILDDDDTQQVNLGFTFSFYGINYTSVFVNSDGNMTFGVGDSASDTLRDLDQFLSGAPRIAPFLADLNPMDPGIPRDGGVFSKVLSDRAVITWNKVPHFFDPADPTIRLHTFQVTLYSSGQIDIGFVTVESNLGVTGISPGRVSRLERVIKFNTDLPLNNLTGAIGEDFHPQQFSFIGLTKQFYRTHGDLYDFLVIFTVGMPSLGRFAFAFALNINNNVRGIGYQNLRAGDGITRLYPNQTFDFSADLGSTGRLQTIVMMNPLTQYPPDPNTLIPGLGTNNTLDILGQENGHRWGTFVYFDDNGTPSSALLGRQLAHWSFFLDTNASVMEGNKIRDNGNGTFTTTEGTQRYSRLDQYLMGLRPKEQVDPFYYVANPATTRYRPESLPTVGVTFGGTRRNVTIDDIVTFEKDRVPSSADAMHTFTGAFILFMPRGTTPGQADIDKLARIRAAWEPFFAQATENQGQYLTSLAGAPTSGTPVTFNIPFYKQTGSEFTGIGITNRSSSLPVNITVTAYDNNGQVIAMPQIQNNRTISILPRQQTARQGNELFGLRNDVAVDGWVQATLTNNEVSSFFLSSASSALDGAVVSSDAATNLVFTQVVEGTRFNQNATTEIYLVNPSGTDAASGQMTLYAANGTPSGPPVAINIPPHGRLTGTIRTLFPGATFPQIGGHIEVSAAQPLVGFELTRYGSGDISTLSAQTVSGARRLYSAHFASGGVGLIPAPFFTEVNLANTTSGTINATLTLVGNDGQTIGSPAQRTINGKATLNGSLTDLFGFPNPTSDTSLRAGSILIEANAPGLVGDVLFGDPTNAAVMSNLPLAATLVTEAVFSQVAVGLGLFTGLAALNPGDAEVQLSITVVDHQGWDVGNTTVRMAPHSRFSNLIQELIPQAAGQLGGYVRIRAQGGGVAAFEIFGDESLRRFNAAVPPQVVSFAP